MLEVEMERRRKDADAEARAEKERRGKQDVADQERDAVMTAWNRDKGQIKVAVEQERERMEMSTKLRLEQRKERRKKLNEMKAEQKRREEELAAAREAAEMKRVEEEAAKREAELVARAAAADRARQAQLETAKRAFQNRLAERLNTDEGAEVTDVMVRCPEVAQRLGGIFQMSKVSALLLCKVHLRLFSFSPIAPPRCCRSFSCSGLTYPTPRPHSPSRSPSTTALPEWRRRNDDEDYTDERAQRRTGA